MPSRAPHARSADIVEISRFGVQLQLLRLLYPQIGETQLLADLELQMTQDTLVWLAGTTAVERNGVLVVTCRNEAARDWLDNRLRSTIERTVDYLTQGPTVQFVTDDGEK